MSLVVFHLIDTECGSTIRISGNGHGSIELKIHSRQRKAGAARGGILAEQEMSLASIINRDRIRSDGSLEFWQQDSGGMLVEDFMPVFRGEI